jgi:mono/diheme cytochrome c family protein
LVLATSPLAAGKPDDAAAGARLYRSGLLRSGRPVVGRQLSGVERAACVACHLRSAMGGVEGGQAIPPIAGPILFAPRGAVGVGRVAYTEATLARAIREGIDPGGRRLGDLMPRYDLGEADMTALAAYLRSLGTTPVEGVDASAIHFAVVVGPGADPVRRDRMLSVLRAFTDYVNSERSAEGRRARGQSPVMRSAPHQTRRWQLHVWELHGPSSGWRRQLEAFHAEQPAFALLSGLVPGGFRPVEEFCEARSVPCLFPNTDLPSTGGEHFYTLYQWRGVTLLADVLAGQLIETAGATPALPVLQVVGRDEEDVAAAEGLRRRLVDAPNAPHIVTVELAGQAPNAAFWTRLLRERRYAALVWWSAAPDLTGLAALDAGLLPRVYVAYRNLLEPPPAPPGLGGYAFAVHPFRSPRDGDRDFSGTLAWLKSHGFKPSGDPIEANTYYAAALAAAALGGSAGSLSPRESLIEAIEYRSDLIAIGPAYSRFSLAAHQHVGAKSARIIRLPDSPDQPPQAQTGWIVP